MIEANYCKKNIKFEAFCLPCYFFVFSGSEGRPSSPEEIYRMTVENFEDRIFVEGIGDEAYIATPGIHILKDGYYITIGVGNLSLPENHERLKEAGKLAKENLENL